MQLRTPGFSGERVGDVGDVEGTAEVVAPDRALDADQQHLVDRLDLLRSSLTADNASTDAPRGLYVHGSVGRGKTWLCDAFFTSAPTAAKRRVHLHDLLRDLHRAIWQVRLAGPSEAAGSTAAAGSPDAAGSPGRTIADVAIGAVLGDSELLYVDEFQIHDSADAVLLTRVLQAVLKRGILLVITSNDAPDDLLGDSEFHALSEPAISWIEAHLDVVELGGTLDYRRVETPGRAERASGFARGCWITPAELDKLSPGMLAPGPVSSGALRRPNSTEHTVLSTNGHEFSARRAADGVVWFHFDDLCEASTAVADYLVWSREFHTWVIEGVPPLRAATAHARQRFAHIVDVLVDRDVTLHVISDSSRREIAHEAGLRDAARLHSRLALLRGAS